MNWRASLLASRILFGSGGPSPSKPAPMNTEALRAARAPLYRCHLRAEI